MPVEASGSCQLQTLINCTESSERCELQNSSQMRLVGPVRDVIIRPAKHAYRPGETCKFSCLRGETFCLLCVFRVGWGFFELSSHFIKHEVSNYLLIYCFLDSLSQSEPIYLKYFVFLYCLRNLNYFKYGLKYFKEFSLFYLVAVILFEMILSRQISNCQLCNGLRSE